MTTSPSEIWNDILKGNVEKDDPLWKEYLDKAAVFDTRLVDQLNKIVDVLLVYVALFISVLTSFIIQTFTQFKRNPAEITNDLLLAIYNQLVTQSNNTSIPPVDPRSYFNQSKADCDAAVIQNALLYTSLSLSIIVSVVALMAKLWLVSYSHQAFSVGSPYERAMKRQEAYNGVLVWNLGGVINMLPVILLITLYLFEIYVYMSISAVQGIIGFAVGVFLNVGAVILCFTLFGGAFVSGCPFRSSLTSFIRFTSEKPQVLIKWILRGRLSSEWLQKLWIGTLTLLCAASSIVIAVTTDAWSSLYFLPAAISVSYFAQQEVVHKPQNSKISHFALWVFLPVLLLKILIEFFYSLLFILVPLFWLVIFSAIWMFSKMSKSMADTGEIDAIAWLLKTAPPQHPATLFRKAGQMTSFNSIGRHYRPRLLESLMPFLTLLISSHHPEYYSPDTHSPLSSPSFDEDPHSKNLEIYIACLARLSEFTDYEGGFWCLREDARQHPKLEQLLIDKLVVLASPRNRFQDGLRSAATKVLSNYELDTEGKPVGSPATVEWSATVVLRRAVSSVATALRSVASILNVNSHEEQRHPDLHRPVELASRVEPPHSSGEVEEA